MLVRVCVESVIPNSVEQHKLLTLKTLKMVSFIKKSQNIIIIIIIITIIMTYLNIIVIVLTMLIFFHNRYRRSNSRSDPKNYVQIRNNEYPVKWIN